MKSIKRWFSSIIDLRKGEVLISTLMFFNIFLILVTYYLLKPARNSIFISVSGAKNLPLVFIAVALVVVPVTTIYSRISRSVNLIQLINYTLIFIISNLLFLRWLIAIPGQSWIAYTFYIWVSIYGVLTTSQFWLLANGIYDATQAKRIFVLFSLGAILGATSGGIITNILIKQFHVSTENLLYFCVAFMGVSLFMINWTWKIAGKNAEAAPVRQRKSRQKTEQPPSMGEVFKDIKSSKYLMMIIAIIVMTMVTATFSDYLLKAAAEISFTPAGATKPDKEALSAFFGQYFGGVSLLSFFVQFFLSYQILRIFGVSGAIMFLPISQILGATAMAVAPGLFTGILVRGSGDIFKYSIDKTGRELLFLPIPLDVKKRVKVFVDVLVDRWFRGLAGAVLFIFTGVLALSVSQISMVLAAMSFGWIFLVLAIRKQYVNAFRSALDKGEIDPEQLTLKITDASTVSHLIKALTSDNDKQVSYALGMLTDVESDTLIDSVRPLLNHQNSEIRVNALKVLHSQKGVRITSQIDDLLNDESPDVRIEALHYLHKPGNVRAVATLRELLISDDFNLQTAALGYIACYGDEQEKSLINEAVIKEFLGRRGKEAKIGRAILADALSKLDSTKTSNYLKSLLKDSSTEVVKAAISSAGDTLDRTFLPELLNFLAKPTFRAEARDALAKFGDRILGTLDDYLKDAHADISIRRNIPRVLRQIATQESVDVLIHNLTTATGELRYSILRVLNQLRKKSPDLNFATEGIKSNLNHSLHVYYRIFQIRHALQNYLQRNNSDFRKQLLEKALTEKLEKTLEEIFQLLSLLYPAKDVYYSYLGIIRDNKTQRASAIEFLDNILQKDIKTLLIPLLDQSMAEKINWRAQKLFNGDISDNDTALAALINESDAWIQSCAIYNIDKTAPPALKELVQNAQNHPDKMVRETANLIIDTFIDDKHNGPPKIF